MDDIERLGHALGQQAWREKVEAERQDELTALRARVAELEADKAAAVEAERARIVAWLRELALHMDRQEGREIEFAADDIERGEHWPDA
jgi:preprotein translocase subunit SecD